MNLLPCWLLFWMLLLLFEPFHFMEKPLHASCGDIKKDALFPFFSSITKNSNTCGLLWWRTCSLDQSCRRGSSEQDQGRESNPVAAVTFTKGYGTMRGLFGLLWWILSGWWLQVGDFRGILERLTKDCWIGREREGTMRMTEEVDDGKEERGRDGEVSYWQRECGGWVKANESLCERIGRLEWFKHERIFWKRERMIGRYVGMFPFIFLYLMRFQILFIILSLTKNLFFQVIQKVDPQSSIFHSTRQTK